jgi:hypothetical protein
LLGGVLVGGLGMAAVLNGFFLFFTISTWSLGPASNWRAHQANSMLVAINPQTLQLYDSVLRPEMGVSPRTITMFNGQMMTYTAGNNLNLQTLYRHVWNPSAIRG